MYKESCKHEIDFLQTLLCIIIDFKCDCMIFKVDFDVLSKIHVLTIKMMLAFHFWILWIVEAKIQYMYSIKLLRLFKKDDDNIYKKF